MSEEEIHGRINLLLQCMYERISDMDYRRPMDITIDEEDYYAIERFIRFI